MLRLRLLIVGGAAAAVLSGFVVLHDPSLDEPCPTSARSAPATAVYLTPTVVQHQNWVGLPTADLVGGDTWIYACADGVIIGRNKTSHVDIDADSGLARVRIATRWVDLAWLSGDLDAYRDPSRWTFVYTPAH
jgi:hypothetical protein